MKATIPRVKSVYYLAGALACLAVATAPLPAAPSGQAKRPFVPTSEYETRSVEGWSVRVNRKLLGERKDLGERALRLLDTKLYEIGRTVPDAAVARLRQVPIWLGVDDGHAPCAEYHPSRRWLQENGYNPDKAKGVEIGNAERFLAWSKSQPSMVLHELAHAYHDQVFGYDEPRIRAAYEAAKQAGSYESILHINGKMQRHYALTNPAEYFAEGTEAYFGTNDFYPFVRAELQRHDPALATLLGEVWSGPPTR
jgi:hypothetical protein